MSVTVSIAAQELGRNEMTVNRWIKQGAPVVRKGRPGRGCPTLVDVQAIRLWRQRGALAVAPTQWIEAFGTELQELVAAGICDAYAQSSCSQKRVMSPDFANSWLTVCHRLIKRLQIDCPRVKLPDQIPLRIEQLRKPK